MGLVSEAGESSPRSRRLVTSSAEVAWLRAGPQRVIDSHVTRESVDENGCQP
jgi:hypothetical protein